MTFLAIVLAATLASGNAEFEETANRGAFDIAAGREKARLVAEGPAKGALAKAMLAKPEAFVKADASKDAAWGVYQAMLEAEYAGLCKQAGERLGLKATDAVFGAEDLERAKTRFDGQYADERAAACAEQAASLVGIVKPSEAEFETKDEGALKREMSAKVAAQQTTPVFEENLGYISQKIVEPVFESAKRERKRQGEYLRRAKSDAYAPSALAKDLADKLALSVKERKAKADDPTVAWDVFPSVTNVTLRNAVHRRTMDRVAAKVAEIPFEVRQDEVAKTMASDRAKHRKAGESKNVFRRTWALGLCMPSVVAVQAEAPEAERKELGDYLAKNTSDEVVAKAVGKRIDEDLLPKLDEVRRNLADAEFVKTWPTLADRTWWPDAETADKTAARSDFKAAVQAWREMPNLALAKGEDAMEESSDRADKSVVAAFETARGAVAAQTKIVDEVHPTVLGEAQERKDSFWSRTPDFGKVVAMLTEAVEARWGETKVGTLWPKGKAPKNADEQHAELFPSVKKRIELVAKSIMAEINKPEPEEQPEDPLMLYSIVVSREGERVTVKLDQGGKTLVEKKAKAQMGDFRGAIRDVGEKLGKEILKLK